MTFQGKRCTLKKTLPPPKKPLFVHGNSACCIVDQLFIQGPFASEWSVDLMELSPVSPPLCKAEGKAEACMVAVGATPAEAYFDIGKEEGKKG